MSAFCFLAMVLAVACTCRALSFSLAFQPFESMEAYPQSFFTTEQITSYATLLCQQGVRIYLGPTSPSLFCPDGSSGSEVGCAYAGNFSASEYLAAASTLPNEAQQLGCARGAWEGGIDCIADDCLPTSHTAKRVDESNKENDQAQKVIQQLHRVNTPAQRVVKPSSSHNATSPNTLATQPRVHQRITRCNKLLEPIHDKNP